MRSDETWADRRPDRAVPEIRVPTLRLVASGPLFAGQRRLAALMVGRVVGGVVLYVAVLAAGWYPLLAPVTWLIYGGTGTALHHLIHGSMGLSPTTRRRLRTILGGLILESGHALEATHLAHHGAGPDPEGFIEHVPWRRMPVEAVRFRYRLMGWGLRHARPSRRRLVRAEIVWQISAHVVSVAVTPWTWWPVAYVASMDLAAIAFAVVAGKGPQTNWGRPIETPLVLVKSRLVRWALFAHDRHLEHHAYPQVPLPRLHLLDDTLAPVFAGLPTLTVRLRLRPLVGAARRLRLRAAARRAGGPVRNPAVDVGWASLIG